MVRVLRAVQRAELRRLRSVLPTRRVALGDDRQLFVESQRELRLDVVERLVRVGIVALDAERRHRVQIRVILALAAELLRHGLNLLVHLLLADGHPRVALVPIHHLVQHVAAVHAAFELRLMAIQRRRSGILAASAEQRQDAVLGVLRDVRQLEPILVRHPQ